MVSVMKIVPLEVIKNYTNMGTPDIKVAMTDYSYCIFTVRQSVWSTLDLLAAINKLI
jgi:hypothetical protein